MRATPFSVETDTPNELDAVFESDQVLHSYMVQHHNGDPAFTAEFLRGALSRPKVFEDVTSVHSKWMFRWDNASKLDVILREMGYIPHWSWNPMMCIHSTGGKPISAWWIQLDYVMEAT
jgi:hypothetical protein